MRTKRVFKIGILISSTRSFNIKLEMLLELFKSQFYLKFNLLIVYYHEFTYEMHNSAVGQPMMRTRLAIIALQTPL